MGLDLRRKEGELPKLVGHRGACDVAPENTLVSFARAWADGADVVEMDLRLSGDGHVVVIHDPTVERTTDGEGWVSLMTLPELKRLDAGSWFDPQFAGAQIPTLSEVLDWARGKVGLLLELKFNTYTSFNPLLVPAVLELLRDAAVLDQVAMISFQSQALEQLKALEPVLPAGPIPTRDPQLSLGVFVSRIFRRTVRWGPMRRLLLRPLAHTRRYGCDVVAPNISVVTPLLVAASHSLGYPVSSGGVAWDYPAAIAMGLDTISANDPGLVRATYLTPRPL